MHAERPDAARYRNPNGVALKLANFAALDPNYPGRGMTRGGQRDSKVWDRYASDEDTLAEAAAAISEGREPPPVPTPENARPHVIETELEAQNVERFQVSVPDQVIEASRREQTLVLAYRPPPVPLCAPGPCPRTYSRAASGPVARPFQAPDVGGWPGGDVRRGLDSVRD